MLERNQVSMRWVPVVDANGRKHMEARWEQRNQVSPLADRRVVSAA